MLSWKLAYTRCLDDLRPAQEVLKHCRAIAKFSDEPGAITRTFLSPAMRSCHAYLSSWMEELGMTVEVDAAGNLRGFYRAHGTCAKRVLIGSHLDSVPNAGPYDGVLGVVLALSLVEALQGERLPFAIEVIGFSEEEGVRFGVPFIGSRALAGTLDKRTLQTRDRTGTSIEQAIQDFGLDVSHLSEMALTASAAAYLEFHIEQGPVLESIGLPLAVVEAIGGQSRAVATFHGKANHAGTTPMHLRQDALCAAAEWIVSVEGEARATDGLVATVGRIEAKPGAANVVPGEVIATLDVRHRDDATRCAMFRALLEEGDSIARRRGILFHSEVVIDQPAVPMDPELAGILAKSIEAVGVTPHRMASGAGHDAMILAPRLPCGMMFLRSPGGISHHPDESVQVGDVALALDAGLHVLRNLSTCSFLN